MNTKTLITNLLAAALLVGAGSASAAKHVSLSDGIRLQMRAASANIESDMRDSVKETRKLDVEGVEAGPLQLVDEGDSKTARAQALVETADAGTDASVGNLMQQALAVKALQAPGLYGVYRYMAFAAINVAITAAE